MRAMVIDDSRAMRMILKRIIGKLDFETTEAADGQEALDLLGAMADEYVIKPFTENAMVEKLALLGLLPTGASS
jgi:DNA-binding response OmpR family regulator